MEGDITENNTDDSIDSITERQFKLCFSMPSNQAPTQSTGTYVSESAFARAIITASSPTIEVLGTSYEPDHNVKIEHAMLLQFPFGVGGFNELRENRVSKKALLAHYQNICLPAF